MATEQFCLRWNDFHANITSAFSEIKEDEDFLDVTLVCDGDMVRAHKLVLSACSPLFRVMLKKNSHPQPMIFLRGIRFPDMVAILNFMYHGEVNVNQEDLQMFLAAAEELRIKGLSQASNEATTVPKKKLVLGAAGSQPPAKKAREGSPGGGSPASSGPGSARSPGLGEEEGEEGPQLSVKREFASGRDNPSRQEAEDEEGSNQGQGNLLDCLMQAGQGYAGLGGQGGGGHGQQTNFEQNNYSSAAHLLGGGGGSLPQTPDSKVSNGSYEHFALGPGRGGSPAPSLKFQGAPNAGGLPYEMHRLGGRNEPCTAFQDGLAHMVVMKTFRGWHCPHCSYISPSQKGNLKVHILNRHANPGESFACMFCGKHLSSRSSLQVHISQVHREQQKAKRMLEERLKITSLEERLKTEMTAAGGNLDFGMGGTAEALRQAMQHEDRMRAQHELGGMPGAQGMARILGQDPQGMARLLGGEPGGFESGPASSSGSLPHSPRQPSQPQEGSPGYSPGMVPTLPERTHEVLPIEVEPPAPPAAEPHYHKEPSADTVAAAYPKELVPEPPMVYHKNVGGHSVSIYPKDLAPAVQEAAYPSAAPASLAPAHYPSSPMAANSYPAAGHHHAMGAPHATTPQD